MDAQTSAAILPFFLMGAPLLGAIFDYMTTGRR